MVKNYPVLPAELVEQLAAVPITGCMDCPKQVMLNDATTLEGV